MAYRTQMTPAFGLRREIDRLFEDAFGGNDTGRRAFGPSVDVHEDAQALTFEFELPGIKPEQVDVSFENGVLTVRGEKRAEREQKEGSRYHRTERSYGSFTRSFQLPQTVDDSQIDASFEHGVLLVRVPKAQRPQPKKIEIRQGAGASSGQRVMQGGADEKASRDEKAAREDRKERSRETATAGASR